MPGRSHSTPDVVTSSRSVVEAAWRAAVEACQPHTVTAAAVANLGLQAPPLLVAVGKAAPGMATGALAALPMGAAGGVIVSETGRPATIGGWPHLRGDHPVPGEGSARAADAISTLIAAHRSVRDALVLVSGGATALIAAPVAPLTTDDLQATFGALLASGADIDEMNAVRRRLLRWADGRLTAALAPTHVHCLVISDVMSQDPATVGSGPCVADPRPLATSLIARLPARVREYLRAAPDVVPSAATARVIASADDARDAAMRALVARQHPPVAPRWLGGPADRAGTEIGRILTSLGAGSFVAAGETTVVLPPGAPPGGRCQELALALAREIDGTDWTVLVAGTDGRDGPTDAAGAIVDGTTWATIARSGRDPGDDLDTHHAYAALDAAGALFRTGPTGTNVNDLLIAVR